MKTIEEEFAEILKVTHAEVTVTAVDTYSDEELNARIQKVQAKHCTRLHKREVFAVLNTIKWSTVEDVLEVIEAIYDDEE